MNELVETRIKPLLEQAVKALDAEIERAEARVKKWDKKWGSVPKQAILNKDSQKRIRQLIRGFDIDNPTDDEKSIAGTRLDAVLK